MCRLIARNGSGTDISLHAYPLLSVSMCYQSPLCMCYVFGMMLWVGTLNAECVRVSSLDGPAIAVCLGIGGVGVVKSHPHPAPPSLGGC